MSAWNSLGLALAGFTMEEMNKTIAKKNDRISALEQENVDLRFNIAELMKALGSTNKEK